MVPDGQAAHSPDHARHLTIRSQIWRPSVNFLAGEDTSESGAVRADGGVRNLPLTCRANALFLVSLLFYAFSLFLASVKIIEC